MPSNATPATDASAAAWAALQPQVTVTGVSIDSPPVVTFKVTNVDGTPIVGLGNTSKSSTATAAGLTNLAFSIAKLVPGTNGSPSRWVSYIVTTVPTTSAAATPTRPSTDNTGTLVDQGLQNPNDATMQGVYTYTFYRDITQIKAQVDGMTVSAPNNKADLGDLTYDPALVHRLTIQLSGNAPGTGNNTPDGTPFSTVPGVQLVKPIDAIYDFIPAQGGAPVSPADSGRDIVATAKCAECHRQLGGIPGDSPESSGAGFHGGSRNETRYCVVCHTEQRKYGRTEATYDATTLSFTKPASCTTTPTTENPDPRCTYRVDDRALGNLPNHIHHIHMGKHLAKKMYDYANVLYNEVLFPQDLRNCTKCHDGSDTSTAKTKQGNNWQNVPNRLACGGCHDGINFATGMGVTIADAAKGLTSTTSNNGFAHGGQSQADDSQCATCHTPGNIDIVHTPVTPPSADSFLNGGTNQNTNSAWIASNTSRLPPGAIKVTYDIKSVAAVADAGGVKRPQMVFRMLQNGARADLNVHDSTAPSPVTGKREIWNNFMGAPSIYFVYAVPQDGITAPADFNASVSAYLRCLWNGTAQLPADPPECISPGTLTGPDTDGYYTATLASGVIPDNAVMLTGGLGYSYNVRSTLPLTQVNLPDYPTTDSPVPVGATDATATSTQLLPSMPNKIGGLIVIAPNLQKVAAGYTGRRPIVEDARCNKCHQELGTFTEDAFHAGQRNDGTTCAWCHNPNRTSSGWSADSTSYIHSIHAGAKRTVPFSWHAASPTENFSEVKFPGVLKDCETCHLPGTYNFAATASAAALPNRLYRTVATGTLASASPTAFTFPPSTSDAAWGGPYITLDFAYGAGFSFAAPTGVTTPAAGTTLVNSPIATQCFACHDTALARTHMELGGASIYKPRSTALTTPETCMVCHDVGRVADIKAMHAK